MESCPHVRQIQLANDKSFLNPRTWTCCDCGTTDSVWACLLCSHVACGRGCAGHALKHFEQTRHPIAIEVNQRYVHCYLCDDYVLNASEIGDIGLVQSLLAQVASQHYQESCTRSGRVIKPASTLMRSESRMEETISHKADKRYTAICHWQYLLISRAFNTWRVYVSCAKQERDSTAVDKPKTPPVKRKKLLIPGMTGLRNLGNTCYMNAILQSLGHLSYFRECFRELAPPMANDPSPLQRKRSSTIFNRQTTVECFQHISTRPVKRPTRLMRQRRVDGLSGGAGGKGRGCNPTTTCPEETPSLCQEMHRLMRVMWSGKWAVVTPHAVLNAVWRCIPSFHGYTQQDAQEFLCELLEQLQGELDQCPPTQTISLTTPFRDIAFPPEILPCIFQGKLASQIAYKVCGHKSRIEELFWDLSLNFPEMYQDCGSSAQRTSITEQCSLDELLEKFTETELLEGEHYMCDTCTRECKLRGTKPRPQCADKTLSISSLPDVLRLHLKRFRWCGRNRHKISTHVKFPLRLDLYPYCSPPMPSSGRVVTFQPEPEDYQYSLSSVIIHHGMGFASGHYTCYCWNQEADSWVHCNDSRMRRCSVDEVLSVQAYILFYIRWRGRSGGCDSWEEEGEPLSKKQKMDPT